MINTMQAIAHGFVGPSRGAALANKVLGAMVYSKKFIIIFVPETV